MCEKIKMVYDCGHYSGVEVWKPPNPADCQAAVSANRRCQITNPLLHCPTEWATYRCKIPGWCQGTLVCKLKNLQESGFSCCICNRRSLGRECACSHPACINCETLIDGIEVNNQPTYMQYEQPELQYTGYEGYERYEEYEGYEGDDEQVNANR
ncbi:hypothetical protein MCOR17_000692 [Pyricularia oryzae]|nr:hypothetical protein MCOR17_000692 [Pyricularia oryzae]